MIKLISWLAYITQLRLISPFIIYSINMISYKWDHTHSPWWNIAINETGPFMILHVHLFIHMYHGRKMSSFPIREHGWKFNLGYGWWYPSHHSIIRSHWITIETIPFRSPLNPTYLKSHSTTTTSSFPLVNVCINMEHHHVLMNWPFSIAILT